MWKTADVAETAPLIANVSDTARWVAAYRAIESARRDALFSDPLADRLAGERGRSMAAAAPWIMLNGASLIARTVLMDRLIATALTQGCDRVLNLAAGLDTRPYRLNLPADLVWIEADLPDLIAEKDAALAAEKPRCALTRTAVDLSDAEARAAFLDEALDGAAKALVVTEGLVMYLDEAAVVGLSQAIARPEVGWWMLDIANEAIVKGMRKNGAKMLAAAPFQFGPVNPIGFLEELGWTPVDIEDTFRAAARMRRLPWFMRLVAMLPGAPEARNPGNKPWGGVVRLTR
ncbi:MAG: class I SAM-dependent methyltransferase [Mycobacteriaceae bacterium]|nr:class I SAM-dependent methyltransferase [Mycobacteriaceae bacterium]